MIGFWLVCVALVTIGIGGAFRFTNRRIAGVESPPLAVPPMAPIFLSTTLPTARTLKTSFFFTVAIALVVTALSPWHRYAGPILPILPAAWDGVYFSIYMTIGIILVGQFIQVQSWSLLNLIVAFWLLSFFVLAHATLYILSTDFTVSLSLWMFVGWHVCTPLAIGVSTLRWHVSPLTRPLLALFCAALISCAIFLLFAGLVVWLHLPALAATDYAAHPHTILLFFDYGVGQVIIGINILAFLVMLWSYRSVLDVWLTSYCAIEVMEVMVAILPGSHRFDLSSYIGRGLGLIAGLVVLTPMLYEMNKLYFRLLLALSNQRRDSDARYRAIVDTAIDAMIVINPAGVIQSFNTAAETMFGYTAAAAIERNINIMIPVCPGNALSVPSLTLGDGHEVQGVRDDGSTMTLDLRLAEWQSVTTKMYTSILRDITAGILIEQQLAQSHKIEVIGRLTSGMAHDFNNILAVAIGNLDLLAEHYADDALPIEITESLFALTGGAALVQRLLAFARRQPLQSQPTNLKVVINALMPLLLRTISAQITIDVAIRDDLALVLVDPIQFENALLNLVLNARDALSQGGKVTIACENFSMDEFSAEAYHTAIGQYVIVAVSDNGHGIPADILSRVFDPFFTTKPVGTGSGLGLSMVFGFVKQSGGVCHIYSEVGIGTTVRLYFPAALDATLPLPVMVDDSDSALFGNERILVVEDTAAARSVAERVLRSLGYHVDSVSDSAEAIDLLELGRYDMLFTDIIMPGPMDGLALAKYVHGRYPAMKIVLLSGFSVTLSADVTALDAVYVTKPYRKSVLAKLLRQQFSESQTV